MSAVRDMIEAELLRVDERIRNTERQRNEQATTARRIEEDLAKMEEEKAILTKALKDLGFTVSRV